MEEQPKPTSRLVNDAHCAQLRHKGMYVLSAPDPDEFTFYDRYDATAYWCLHTQKALGPDGQPANAEQCQGGRDCCRH